VSGAIAAPPVTPAAAAVCAAALLAALALDRLDPLWGQLAAGLVLWTFALRLIGQATAAGRHTLFLCMVWATAGELFCSLVWGLYTYRLGNIPHFVPAGHVLLFLVGWHLAPRVSAGLANALTGAYVALTALGYWFFRDELSVLLFAVYALLYWREPALRSLLATVYALTLGIELYGTSLGVWGWAERAPVLGLATTNPPFAVAAFYCTLDALCVWTLRARRPRPSGDPLGDRGAGLVQWLADDVDKGRLAAPVTSAISRRLRAALARAGHSASRTPMRRAGCRPLRARPGRRRARAVRTPRGRRSRRRR